MTHNTLAKRKGINGEAVIRMTHNTMAKRKETNEEAVIRMTHNTMAKSKGHTIQWPKVKDTQYNDQK